MKEEKEVSFFKKLIISIKDFEKYPELASKNWNIVIAYFVKLLAIFVLLISFLYVYDLAKEFNQELQYVKEEIPNFTFANDQLQVEQTSAIIEENRNHLLDTIIIDTNPVGEETFHHYQEILQKAGNGILLLEDKMLVKTQMSSQTITYSYDTIVENYPVESFNKQEFLQYFSGRNLIFISIGLFIMLSLYSFVLYFISTWLDIFLLGAFGFLTALILRLHLRYSAMCKIAIHSLTLPILLSILVNFIETFTTFQIKYFEIMYITIAYIYIVTAILMIKSDVIKSQKELAKILQEQVKIREELERQKEQEEEERQEEERQKEKEQQRKKEKKEEKEKDKNVGQEPQGENA